MGGAVGLGSVVRVDAGERWGRTRHVKPKAGRAVGGSLIAGSNGAGLLVSLVPLELLGGIPHA